MKDQWYVICYTRLAQDEFIYSRKLADSMHLALQKGQGQLIALNHNSGILYAKAVQREDGTLCAKSLKTPRLYGRKDGSFAVIARRIQENGSADPEAEGKLLVFTSPDLIHYQEQLICPEEAEGELAGLCAAYERDSQQTLTLLVPADSSLPEGAVFGNRLPVTEETAIRLQHRFLTPVNVANRVPEEVEASCPEDLAAVKAQAFYSDGSRAEKRVDWRVDGVDWSRPGRIRVEGRIHQDRFEFPVAWHKADPCIGKWKGKYYFISTNDLDHEHSIYIRKADSISGLVTAQQVKILDAYTYPHLGNLLWAPEFHVIRDRLYVFHAGTPQEFHKEQCHVMALKEGGDPMKASDWEMPVRVVRKDGSPLYGDEGITLDMTEFEAGGQYYVCWSQRQFYPVDQGAWLYIARLNPDEPWKLASDPVLLSMPEYGWANNHTFVDEGPFALIREGRLFLTFSSAAVDSTYVVGLLSADPEADLLDPSVWTKENCPLLSSRSAEGEFGTGHNAYVEDEDGLVWNTYHARPGVDGPRSTGIRRVHFNAEGFPVLDLTEELDLKPELAEVSTLVVIPG